MQPGATGPLASGRRGPARRPARSSPRRPTGMMRVRSADVRPSAHLTGRLAHGRRACRRDSRWRPSKRSGGMRGLPILEGILPIDPSRISTDVIAGATLAALAIPEVMGYTKIAGMPVITGLYTILLPIIFFAILGSSRHLVVGRGLRDGRDHGHGPRGDGRGGRLHQLRRAGLAVRPHVRGPARARPRSPARLHRQLPVAERPHRLPDGRRHPGRDGPVRRHVRHPVAERRHDREVRRDAQADPDRHEPRHPRGLGLRPGHDPRPRPRQQEDPGRAHRRRGLDRGQLLPGPRGQGRHRPRDGAQRAADARAAHGGHDARPTWRPCCPPSSRSSS